MGLFSPAWMTKDESKLDKALDFIAKTEDKKLLKQIKSDAPLPEVRKAAEKKMVNIAGQEMAMMESFQNMQEDFADVFKALDEAMKDINR